MISKKYFPWPLTRSLSSPHLCVSVNICKQKSQEIPEVTCTRRTIMDFLHETPLIWVIGLGVKLWLVYFRSLHTCKNYLINAQYMINIYTKHEIFGCVNISLLLIIFLSSYFLHFYVLLGSSAVYSLVAIGWIFTWLNGKRDCFASIHNFYLAKVDLF